MATIETAYYVPTFLGLSTTFGISCSISVACFIAFEICKRLDSMKYLFSPRTQLLENPSPKQRSHLFSWISSTIHLDENDYVIKVGLDATMHLRFLRMVVQFLLINCIIICPILLGLHWTGASVSLNSDDLAREFTSLAKNETNSPPVNNNQVYRLLVSNDTLTHNANGTLVEDEDDISADKVSLPNLYGSGFPIFQNIDNSSKNGQSLPVVDHFRSNSTLYHFSIANIPNRDPIVWVHTVFTFSISLGWLWLLFVNHLHHIKLLQQQQQQERNEIDNGQSTSRRALIHERSVLVTHIPHALRNKKSLQQYFHTHLLIGEDVESITMIYDAAVKRLRPLLKKRARAIDEMEIELIRIVRKVALHTKKQQQQHQTVAMHSINSPGTNVDWYEWLNYVIQYQKQMEVKNSVEKVRKLLDQLQQLDNDILHLRDEKLSSELYKTTATAFITFKSPHSAQACAQMVTSWKPGVLSTRMAPEPRDLLWRSLLRRGRKSRIAGIFRQCIVFVAVWSLTIFWLFPISFILGLTSIQSLSNHLAFLRYFLASSLVIRTFVQNILPTLLVTLFMSLLPWTVLEISKRQDFLCFSELEDAVLGRYYHFAIFNVLIVFLLGTTFLTTMLDVLYEPTMLIQLLANALPQGANFFLNYILFNCCTHAMELVQLGSQIFGHLFFTQPFISRTPRLRLKYTQPWSFLYYYYYPHHILVFVITLTYSVIQPLILVFSLFYFGFALVVYRHQYMYCYIRRRYESNGTRHYRRMARYTSDGLLIFQLTMVGLLYLKGVIAAATAILPLVVFTVWAKMRLHSLLKSRLDHPPTLQVNQHLPESCTAATTSTTAATSLSSLIVAPGSTDKTEECYPKNRRSKIHMPSLCNRWCRYVNDIWKFSYLRDWWDIGRYAPDQQQQQIKINSKSELTGPIDRASTKLDDRLFIVTHKLQAVGATEPAEESSLTSVCLGDDGHEPIYQHKEHQCINGHEKNSIRTDAQKSPVDIEMLVGQSTIPAHYARRSNRIYNDTEENSTSSFNIPNNDDRQDSHTNNMDHEKPLYQRRHDFTVYTNDYKSDFETYEHPAIVKPLTTDFILPLNIALYYWNLEECVYVSFDVIRTIFNS